MRMKLFTTIQKKTQKAYRVILIVQGMQCGGGMTFKTLKEVYAFGGKRVKENKS